MIGSIQKKGRIYYVVLSTGRDPTTRRWKTKWVPIGPDRSEAERLMPEIRARYEKGRYQENEKMTVAEYLNMWLEAYAAKIRRSTLESYIWAVEKHLVPAIGLELLQKLTPMKIQKAISDLSKNTTLSATSVRYVYNVLSNALTRAVKWQLLSNNPCIAVEPPRKEKFHASVYNREELQQLITAARGTMFLIPILLAAGCGMRRGEVCGLRWQDVELNQKLLFIRHSLDRPEKGKLTLLPVKTDNSERAVRIPEFLEQPLAATRQKQTQLMEAADSIYTDEDFVFAWDNGSPVDPDYLDKKFRRLLTDNGLRPIRFHDLRHTHATLLLMEHVAVKVVSERLGHSSINITQDIYSHVLPEMQKEAADAIDRVFAKAAAEQLQAVNDNNVIDFAARAAARKKNIPCA